MEIALARCRDHQGKLNYRMAGQEIRAYVDEHRLSLREAFEAMVDERLGQPEPEGITTYDVVLLAEQASPNHTMAEAMLLLWYTFGLTPENARQSFFDLFSVARWRIDHIDRLAFIVVEDYLGLSRGTLYDLENWK